MLLYKIGEHPESISSNNLITETFGKESPFIIVSTNPLTHTIACGNGFGRYCLFLDETKLQPTISNEKLKSMSCENFKNMSNENLPNLAVEKDDFNVELHPNICFSGSIDKTPIFINNLTIDGVNFVIIGSSDGCLYFASENMKNYYRHEEAVQCYFIEKVLKNVIIIIVGQSGFISFFSNFLPLPSKIPKFLDFAEYEIEEIRRALGDFETPPESLVYTYLYMPLP